MIKKAHHHKRFLSALFASVYLFAIVFSGFFHTHANNFKDNLACFKNQPISSKIINFGGADDCFSSHFFNAGTGILGSDTIFEIVLLEILPQKKYHFSSFSSTEKNYFFSLRAPPFFI